MTEDKPTKERIFSFRASDDLGLLISEFAKATQLNYTAIIEIALFKLFGEVKEEFVLEGVNLKEYAELKYRRKLRRLESFKTSELKSEHLFLDRVKKDVYLYLIKQKPEKKIFELLRTYQKQAIQYKFKEALKEIDTFIELCEKDQFAEFKTIIENRFKINFIKTITQKNGKDKTINGQKK